eukprot:GHRQ01007908.1.p1 GENE.GHRQ01007908.1~~GHRQ01007908.1.p1  ORF type:complete len:144 (+),score=14.45 GHRQ01007908.1:97-528(+)
MASVPGSCLTHSLTCHTHTHTRVVESAGLALFAYIVSFLSCNASLCGLVKLPFCRNPALSCCAAPDRFTMCQPVAGPFYRAAGMTYLRYANICADLMRGVLKEPFKTKAMQRQAIYFRSAPWADGKQGTSVITELKEVPTAKP